MNPKKLQAELWETQVWLMWILDVMLFHEGHWILGFVVLLWSIISSIGVVAKLAIAGYEDSKDKQK